MTPDELQRALDAAAERGADRALCRLGLTHDTAADDIHDVISFIRAWKLGKKTAFTAVVKLIATAIVIYAAVSIGLNANYFPR